MPNELTTLMQSMRQRFTHETLSDCELLHHFETERVESAFTELVKRHGPLVMGVCVRVLRDHGDAEDAFQATFLVLARKAHVVRWEKSVAGWLYQVALRVAQKARARNARRKTREASFCAENFATCSQQDSVELHELLDSEVKRLPEHFRLPIVLCYFQGLPQEKAAKLLDSPVGTIKTRLARGRKLLHQRLVRRGITLSLGGLAAALAQQAASGAVAPPLVLSTGSAATAFAAGGVMSGAAATLAKQVLGWTAAAWTKWALAATVGFVLVFSGA